MEEGARGVVTIGLTLVAVSCGNIPSQKIVLFHNLILELLLVLLKDRISATVSTHLHSL